MISEEKLIKNNQIYAKIEINIGKNKSFYIKITKIP